MRNKNTLFTVGPVEMYPESLKIEGTQPPYFRTNEFSELMLDIEKYFINSIFASNKTKFVCLTSSGTGAMEAVVINALNKNDKVLIINGGSFGNRFKQICELHQIPNDEYFIPYGFSFDKSEFEKFNNSGYTALLVNACETSTGQKYDLDYLGAFCKKNNITFIVDAVSAYLADPIYMEKQNIDILLTASQKALALSPGLALIALSEKVYEERILKNKKASYYFDFEDYIENQKRGQPPFTSAVSIVLSLHQRLEKINQNGVESEWITHKRRAEYFRKNIISLPLKLPSFDMSNCCTSLLFDDINAFDLYENLKKQDGIFLTPSGGEIKAKQLRVGHLGNLSFDDYDYLIEKLGEKLI